MAVVVGVSPAFGRELWMALNGMTVAEVLRQVLAGIEEEGLHSRLVRVRRSIDLGSIGWTAARLSGSGVSVGLQAKGTEGLPSRGQVRRKQPASLLCIGLPSAGLCDLKGCEKPFGNVWRA